MRSLHTLTGALAAGLFLIVAVAPASAVPITPTRDDEVVEVLPATSASRGEDRATRKSSPRIRRTSASRSRSRKRYLDQAHTTGDPRYVGLALAGLRPWPDAASAPPDVLLMRATLQQYLHEFDASVASLRSLLARPESERNAQAWLTLATVLRVQGKYADSDVACRTSPPPARRSTRPRASPRTRRCAATSRPRERASSRCSRILACPRARAAGSGLACRARGARRPQRRGRRRLSRRAAARPRQLRRARLCRLPDPPTSPGRRVARAQGRGPDRHRAAAPRDRRRDGEIAGQRARRRRDARADRARERAAGGAHLPRPGAGDVRAGDRQGSRPRTRARARRRRAAARSRSTCWCSPKRRARAARLRRSSRRGS